MIVKDWAAVVSDEIVASYNHGTRRSCPPFSTINKVTTLSKVMGVTRIANVTGLDFVGVPVVMVVRPKSKSLSVSQGKGLSLDAAKASGLMESIELYHAENITNGFYPEFTDTSKKADNGRGGVS